MGVSTHIMADYTSKVAPTRLFHGLCIDIHNFLPIVIPGFVTSVDRVHGDFGSVGSIRQVNLSAGRPFKYIKNRVDEIDASKFYAKYTTIEGGVLGDYIEQAVYETMFEPVRDGCRYTMVVHYRTKGDFVVKEEHIVASKRFIKMMFDAAEEFLTANPQLYA